MFFIFYIFLRNIMAFDKELAILSGFFNLRISKETTLEEKSPNEAQNNFFFFFFWIFVLFYVKMDIILYKTATLYVLNQSRSLLLVLPKYTLENQKIWSFFSVFDGVITQSRDLGGSFLVC